jgi:hypothetical protein
MAESEEGTASHRLKMMEEDVLPAVARRGKGGEERGNARAEPEAKP